MDRRSLEAVEVKIEGLVYNEIPDLVTVCVELAF